jgi:hypothetical protein
MSFDRNANPEGRLLRGLVLRIDRYLNTALPMEHFNASIKTSAAGLVWSTRRGN